MAMKMWILYATKYIAQLYNLITTLQNAWWILKFNFYYENHCSEIKIESENTHQR